MAHRFGSTAPGQSQQEKRNHSDEDDDDEWLGIGSSSTKKLNLNSSTPFPNGAPAAAISGAIPTYHQQQFSSIPYQQQQQQTSASQANGSAAAAAAFTNLPPPPQIRSAIIMGTSFAQQVAEHYDSGTASQQKHRRLGRPTNRNQSRIIRLRSFNNWVKALLLQEALRTLKNRSSQEGYENLKEINILDMACGKGGDIGKYDQCKMEGAPIRHVTFIDISAESIKDCQHRYGVNPHGPRRAWEADFHVADCAHTNIFENNDTILSRKQFQLVICHFAVHYSFENFERARQMLENLCSRLVPGGMLILTTMDSFEIVRRLREVSARRAAATASKAGGAGHADDSDNEDDGETGVGAARLSNPMFQLQPHFNLNTPIPLFGATYDFKLDEVVNLPEFLVHGPTLEDMASRHFMFPDDGLSKQFPLLFERFCVRSDVAANAQHRNLLVRMGGLRRCTRKDFDESGRARAMGSSEQSSSLQSRNAAGGDDEEESYADFDDGSSGGTALSAGDMVEAKQFLKQFQHARAPVLEGAAAAAAAAAATDKTAEQPAAVEDAATSVEAAAAAAASAAAAAEETVGTLSKDEWEIVSLYKAFVFTKHRQAKEYEKRAAEALAASKPPSPPPVLGGRAALLAKMGVNWMSNKRS